jgi:putative transposase
MCTLFIETVSNYRQEGAYALHAFVLMPDHFHILLTPAQDKTLERVVQLIKGGSAYRIGVNLQMKFPVWQRGFSDHRIRDAADYDSHFRYLENNPVQKHLATKVGEYPWSSGSGKYEMDAAPQGLKPKERSAVWHG